MAKKVITGEDFVKRNEEIEKKLTELEKEEKIKSLKLLIDEAITHNWEKKEYIEYILLESYLSQQDRVNLEKYKDIIVDWLRERKFFLKYTNCDEYVLLFSEENVLQDTYS